MGLDGSQFETFKARSVFVTGHTGFKGSWLCIWLHRLGARISGYSLEPPTKPSNFEISGVRELIQSHHEADICNVEQLTSAIQMAEPDVVIHLAAQSLVRESYRSPRKTFETNVIGTACVLEAVTALGRPCVVLIITSDKCYENHGQNGGYRECDSMGGQDPYSASKGAQELLVAAYRDSFFHPERLKAHGVKLASARAGNVIGGGDWAPDRIVTDVVSSLIAKRPIPVRNPDAVRPWQHVLEPLAGYLMLASRMLESDSPSYCTPWNFGPMPGDELSVRDFVGRFIDFWGGGSWENVRRSDQPHEAQVLRLSIDKAVSELGWKPRWPVEVAIERTAAWFRRLQTDKDSMYTACVEEIEAYADAMAQESSAVHGLADKADHS